VSSTSHVGSSGTTGNDRSKSEAAAGSRNYHGNGSNNYGGSGGGRGGPKEKL
jgi:hypothetical protein